MPRGDYQAVTESALERVLRLSRRDSPLDLLLRLTRIPMGSGVSGPGGGAGAAPAGTGRKPVNVRQYQRTERGRPQVVRQHVQGHVAGRGVFRASRVFAGALKPGEVIQVGQLTYTVQSVKPYVPRQTGPNRKGTTTGKSTGSKGKGVSTGGPKPTGSAGKGMNTKSVDPQSALDATAKALGLGFSSPEVEVGLRQVNTGAYFNILVPKALPVVVVR